MNNSLNKISNIITNKTLVAAISGGPDSMALLNILLEKREKFDITIICAHVNHNVRDESKEEKEFIKRYCKQNNIIFEDMIITKEIKTNFHNEARNIRYNFFKKIMDKYQTDILLTAHHADDLIETILMRIVRGSTLKGYAGFNEISTDSKYQIIRPLINNYKEEILKYLKDNNLKYVTDNSNSKDKYTRNRFRHKILPFLKEENEDIKAQFLKFNRTLNEANDFITKKANEELESINSSRGLNIKKLNKNESVIIRRIIEILLKDNFGNDLDLISYNNILEIKKILSSKKPNIILNLPKNKVCIKSYNYLKIKDNVEEENYRYVFKNRIELKKGKIIEEIEDIKEDSNFICRLDSNDIELPLIVRNRRNGDKIDVKGLNGSKKIKDIFINSKINSDDRKTWPIVLDNTGKIIWIPGLKKSKLNKNQNDKCDIILRYY